MHSLRVMTSSKGIQLWHPRWSGERSPKRSRGLSAPVGVPFRTWGQVPKRQRLRPPTPVRGALRSNEGGTRAEMHSCDYRECANTDRHPPSILVAFGPRSDLENSAGDQSRNQDSNKRKNGRDHDRRGGKNDAVISIVLTPSPLRNPPDGCTQATGSRYRPTGVQEA